MTADPILRITNASKHFVSGDTVVRALDGVSIEVRPGELVGILGASGSGKSTMLLLAGLLEVPTAGTVDLLGTTVSYPDARLDRLRDLRRRHIGFVFQKANLIPFLTAAENVALALEIDDVPARAALNHAVALLEELGLGHRVDNRPARLSGGEQQRVAIARALANAPPLLLADEPTAALDSVRGRHVMELFHHISRSAGTAVVVVTHDPRSLDLFDRTYEFSDGKVIAEHRGNHTAPAMPLWEPRPHLTD
ncbi:ABC transporter ATP-binding protein [Acuticoccus mangrovi]|uniref:ABC transporter ATP-binding protein n=1 Tax=Acuticoccus mangrovi TaxID=2796142 RepID=A0A934IMV2_9HYPH|nr:ABC transporter ATP-binding protein [Acuticoccus mangrovi]MBJ3775132.1 ABC transporter ATP-binding protein [Acuticoccus mangrovi]